MSSCMPRLSTYILFAIGAVLLAPIWIPYKLGVRLADAITSRKRCRSSNI